MSNSPEHSSTGAYEGVSVDLRCDFPGADVLLIDGHQRLVGHGTQRLRLNVLPGIYTARVRVAEASRDERLVVYPCESVDRMIAPPVVGSPIPLAGWAKSHEDHQEAARRAIALEARGGLTAHASIFVLLREWTPDGKGLRSSGPLAVELILRAVDGREIHRFKVDTPALRDGDRATAGSVRVAAGFYRLVSRFAGVTVELPVYAIAGWQTQIFMLSQPTSVGLAPDMSRASILWSKLGTPFDPQREDIRVYEALRSSAESGRPDITDRGVSEALYTKYHNPMLGLVSAHALRERAAIDVPLLSTVTQNLEQVLGPIPDVLALKLELDPGAKVGVIELPPLLRSSWQILLRHTVRRPELVRPGSLASEVACRTIGRGLWMAWIADADVAKGDTTTPTIFDAAFSARSALQQLNLRLHGVQVDGLQGRLAHEGARPRGIEQVVRTFAIPRSVIDEASRLAVASRPQTTITGGSMDQARRRQFSERFVQRLMARRPRERAQIEDELRQPAARLVPESAALADLTLGATGTDFLRDPRDVALETIVKRERPVLFVKEGRFDSDDVTILGPEANDLVQLMREQGERLLPLLPLIGRIDVVNFPGSDFVGTGWFVDTDIVVTNRHVASLIARWDGRKFAFIRGVAGRPFEASLCNAHEFDELAPDASRVFMVTEVLYIEPDAGPNDIAFLRVQRRTDGRGPAFIEVAGSDASDELPVCVIGYPARASKRIIPDQELMKDLYRDRYDIKRAAPGFISGTSQGSMTHDCTTLGGCSGAVVLDLRSGKAVGLHYAGLYQEDNFAVRSSVLSDYIRRKRWTAPSIIETSRPPGSMSVRPDPLSTEAGGAAPGAVPVAAIQAAPSVSITIPLTVTLSVGTPQSGMAPGVTNVPVEISSVTVPGPVRGRPAGAPSPEPVSLPRVEEVLPLFWDQRPAGVLAARIGFSDEGDAIGNAPCIAASVVPSQWPDLEAGGPHYFKGVPVRYLPADLDEQVQSLPTVESVDAISYDDAARTGPRFSFDPVDETMDVVMHVGPEYSWDVLKQFLAEAQGRLVSAMYEFHASHIKDALEARLDDGGSLTLVLDNATFAKLDPTQTFDRSSVFEDWAGRYPFNRIVAPEGTGGLISDSYHIKVTVRDDDKFWLSSGNWKASSSQPIITQAQRDNAFDEDLPGNREWHVVIKNKSLASRFRNHILQDFSRSRDLGGGPVSPSLMEETLVDVPLEETIELERRPPGQVLKPVTLRKKMRVRPLLTPDREGAVYSEAVLDLIASARSSLLFQIPYIGMPPNPRQSRGFIDELISALSGKLKSLDDARVLLRSGGQKFSAPTHAAWYFKSKGVDIDNRVRVIEDHHTKGMIVDGKRVLLGSHNWSKPGVTLNRDASLLFDDEQVAEYYARAFEIDWARSNPIRPKRFVKPEAVVFEATGDGPPPGFRRVRLSDLVKDD